MYGTRSFVSSSQHIGDSPYSSQKLFLLLNFDRGHIELEKKFAVLGNSGEYLRKMFIALASA
jgi:hypothetical protein